MQYSARPWQNTKPTVTPLLQTHCLRNLSPESRAGQGVNAILQIPPTDLLSLTPSAYTQSLTAFSLIKPSICQEEEEEEEAVLTRGCTGTPAAVRMPSHTAGFQHRGIIRTGEQLSAIPPRWDVAELLKPPSCFTPKPLSFSPEDDSPRCSSPLRFVSATPAFGWVQNPVQKEWPDRN